MPSSKTNTRGPGRPPTWPSKIAAPEAALALYRAIAAVQNSTAFQTCHIYKGAQNANGLPLIRFEGHVHSLPALIASFIGLQTHHKRCDTPGCCNPFHYLGENLDSNILIHAAPGAEPLYSPELATPTVEDWVDLIDYTVSSSTLPSFAITKEAVRALIPVEDLSVEAFDTAWPIWSSSRA